MATGWNKVFDRQYANEKSKAQDKLATLQGKLSSLNEKEKALTELKDGIEDEAFYNDFIAGKPEALKLFIKAGVEQKQGRERQRIRMW